MEKRTSTEAGAAKRMNVSQPRISDLTPDKIRRFSLDAQLNLLTDAGMEVDVRVRQPSRRLA
ncbi:MAG: XRE family transcriptional regulator [Bryobacterales bacterium]|nr:XRE family transcriptional regulator [Bryobacterales bacterium]